jgi:hypothetical protein
MLARISVLFMKKMAANLAQMESLNVLVVNSALEKTLGNGG